MIPLSERLGLFEHSQDSELRVAHEELIVKGLIPNGAEDGGDGLFIEARLNERAEGLRFLKLLEELVYAQIKELAKI